LAETVLCQTQSCARKQQSSKGTSIYMQDRSMASHVNAKAPVDLPHC
jgi:hypothetical protein